MVRGGGGEAEGEVQELQGEREGFRSGVRGCSMRERGGRGGEGTMPPSKSMVHGTRLRNCKIIERISPTSYAGTEMVCSPPLLSSPPPAGTEVVCVAQNDAVLEGLLTVFHVERSDDTEVMVNVQASTYV